MKAAIAVLMVAALVLSGCTAGPSATPSPTPTASPSASIAALECQTDTDCVVSGCSGQICQAKSKPPAVTTCEYRDDYVCYKPGGCLCQAGTCAWSADAVQCVKDMFESSSQLEGQKEAEFNCVQSCREARARGTDLSAGPCLSNAAAPGWVCDVAHSPRQAVDDLDANTCPAFGVSARHFVEVDQDCQIIQTV
ncbi:eight-cysteine-cluster domain-containing protein [Candidatus Micrarchaeota archaeon]|nr:eight-cysteine-cluster domain-containing protein [Candidatus Micrarchaeota archaeon]